VLLNRGSPDGAKAAATKVAAVKVAIIGAGNVGGTPGTAWAQKAGHEIVFGARSPNSDKTQALLRMLGGKARAGMAAEPAAFGEMIMLATPWPATEAAIRCIGERGGRVLLDATNPLTMGPGGLGLEIGHSISAGEKVQSCAKGAAVFKTLNTTGFGNMADPVFHGVKSHVRSRRLRGQQTERDRTRGDARLRRRRRGPTPQCPPVRGTRHGVDRAWLKRRMGHDFAFAVVSR
jgi:predicted dinucleotide-binding enzyme